ncbi:hypothetical protein AAY473_028569, partial [Plecturocebus cupreus]
MTPLGVVEVTKHTAYKAAFNSEVGCTGDEPEDLTLSPRLKYRGVIMAYCGLKFLVHIYRKSIPSGRNSKDLILEA